MDLDALCNTLGVEIDRNLLQQALTHRSYAYEHGGIPNSERLELLGDSVLGFVVTEHIYQTLPTLDEGELTKVKNSVVSEKALAFAARQIGLGDHLLLGKGEINTGGRDKPSLLCDVFEAVHLPVTGRPRRIASAERPKDPNHRSGTGQEAR
jgi:ribonuclease-3